MNEIKKKFRRAMWPRLRIAFGVRRMIPLLMISVGIPIAIGMGFAIMGLWNWIMPAVFGLGMITFWQAIGILILGRLIFGGFRKHRHWSWGMKHQYAYAHCQHKYNKPKDTPADNTIA